MCGIAGILNFGGEPAAIRLVQVMTEAIRHRGPDGDGHYVDGPVALGHRRLAIIDLTPAGRQPMQSADGRFVVTYNGELYNFQELKAELESKGRRFRSRSDTEVLLEAWAEWGPDCLPRFNGMFAFALWDRRERVLHLARDRYGVKPLYYANDGQHVLFASEVKAFLRHPDFAVRLDRPALLEYFTFQNLFSDRTLFQGVHLLPAGSLLSVPADGRAAEPRRYWDFAFEEGPGGNADDLAMELQHLLRQAVQRQLVSDVDIGSYLSGGMDSGTIAAIAAGQIPDLRTFTVGFDLSSASGLELAYDERQRAERMSYLFRTEHYEMVLKAGDMERCMSRLVWHLEDPRVGQSYPNFYAAQLASRFGKVVLSGTGGDETFAGYPWRYYRAVVNDDFEHYVDKYYGFWQRLLPADQVQAVFRPIWGDVADVSTRDLFRDVFHRHAGRLTRPEDYINHSLYFEAKTFLHGLLLVEDKLAMAHGLEARVPFLDNDLVDFACRLPVGFKLGNLDAVVRLNENEPGPKTERYFQQTRDGKLLLRRAMRAYVPEEIAEGVKQGFSAPDASWFRGESIEYVRSVLHSPHARLYDVLDRKTVTGLVDEHLSGRTNRRLLIWSLLCFEEWNRRFLGDGAAP